MSQPIITVENLSKRYHASCETLDNRHWTIDSDASAAPFFSLKSIVQGLKSSPPSLGLTSNVQGLTSDSQTSGRAIILGRVASLLEVGADMLPASHRLHPEGGMA